MSIDPIRSAAVGSIRDVLNLFDQEPGSPEAVHGLRVCTKKLRAYLRVYPGKAPIRDANRQLKQLADSYSGTRDAHVLRETLEHVMSSWPLRKRKKYQRVIDDLSSIKQHGNTDLRPLEPRAAFEQIMTVWPNVDSGQDFWATGLDRVFIKAQVLGENAIKSTEDEPYHRWRKWVKYWLYGLTGVAKGQVAPGYNKRLKRLGEGLGHFHDLCVLEEVICSHESRERHGADLKPFLKAIASEKKDLKKSFKKAHKVLFKVNYRKRQKMAGRTK